MSDWGKGAGPGIESNNREPYTGERMPIRRRWRASVGTRRGDKSDEDEDVDEDVGEDNVGSR